MTVITIYIADSNNNIILVNSEKSNSSNGSTLQKANKNQKKTKLVIVWSTESKKVNSLRLEIPLYNRCQNGRLRN